MRIAVLTNAYPPRAQGGAGRIAAVYAQELERAGHEVRVWGPRPEFYELAKRSALSRLFFHLGDVFAVRSTVDEIVAWKPDVLLSHNLTGCGIGTPSAIQSKGVRWVHVLHDVQLFEPSGQMIFGEAYAWLRQVWRWKWALLRRVALRKPGAVVSPTKWLLDLHRMYGFFGDVRSEVIPNPIVLAPVEASLKRDPRQVLFVSRLDWDKGVDLLVDAWDQLRAVASKLVLISAGSFLDEIKARGDATIEVRGQQSSAEVARALHESGVVVVPSRVLENQSTVILEALAAGCRVVATDVGGTRETLGEAGWIVKPGSVDALAEAIRWALDASNDEKYTEARAVILPIHNPRSCVAKLERLLR